MKKTSRRRTSRRRTSLRRNSTSALALIERAEDAIAAGDSRTAENALNQLAEEALDRSSWKTRRGAWPFETERYWRAVDGMKALRMRKNGRRRTSLRRNRGDYRSGMLTDRDYMSLGDRLTRSVLSTAGYKPHNNFEEDSKHWRQARIDALAALMVESMLDGPRAGIEERDAAMHIAVDVAQRNRY